MQLRDAALYISAATLISAAVPFYVFAEVTAVAFVSPEQTVAPNKVSEQLTMQMQDDSGNAAKAPSTACASLSSSSGSGQFSSSATNWNPVNVLTISKNSANRNFYYQDSSAGVHTMTVRVALKSEGEGRSCASWPFAEWGSVWSASQQITVEAANVTREESSAAATSTQSTDTATSSQDQSIPPMAPPSGNGSVGGAYEQRIFASAKVPQKTAAGADTAFEAVAIGLLKEPIPNARFVWSFGDGASAEGKKAYHAYHYPGSYVVLVTASSGEWSATDRKDITVSAPLLSIVRIEPGPTGYIEIENRGRDDVDLSRWFLASQGSFFSFPEGTIVRAGRSVPFPGAVTKLDAAPGAELLYPNGTTVVRLVPKLEEPSTPVPPAVLSMAAMPPVRPVRMPRVEDTVSSQPVLETEVESRLPTRDLAAARGTSSQSGSATWFLAALALSVIASCGYLFVSRGLRNPKQQEGLSAKEFDIVE